MTMYDTDPQGWSAQQNLLVVSDVRHVSVQVYRKLPVQKLSGFPYDVEEFDAYSCIDLPMPQPIPLPDLEISPFEDRRKRSFIEPPRGKNDVYSIFKVLNCFGDLEDDLSIIYQHVSYEISL